MRGIAVGTELMCRMSLVAPQATHKGELPSDRDLRRRRPRPRLVPRLVSTPNQIARAMGISGSLASGIIEYLADGSSTKRLHAGAAAQAGIRAALLAEGGFTGPLTVFDGTNGMYEGLRAVQGPGFQPPCRYARQGVDPGDARLQTLCLRNHDAALHRLCDCAGRIRA